MSQRNAMNERNTGQKEVTGVSRKSAGSMKPKKKAAESVHVKKAPVTAAEKRAAQKQADKERRAERRERERAAAKDPRLTAYMDTPEYKKWRRVWWVALIIAILATVFSWVANKNLSASVGLSYVLIGFAYLSIFFAIYIDLKKIRPMRKVANAMTISKNEMKRREKAAKAEAEEKAAKEAAEKEAKAAAKAAKEEARKSKSEMKGANANASDELNSDAAVSKPISETKDAN